MTTLLAFLFVLGVLIFVHELGHFLMARRIGVRVLTFSLGFGPKLLKITRGGTEYCLSAIPLGGYVKMAGENPEDSHTGAPDEFLSKSKWQRFQVLIMGPVMNLVLAVIVLAVVLYQGAPRPLFERQPVVIGTFAEGSAGAQAGLKIGDRIVTVDGEAVENWEQYSTAIVPKAKRNVTLGFVRDGRAGQVTVVPASQGKYELGNLGIQPLVHPEIIMVNTGQPAERAGLQTGDVIMAVEGTPDVSLPQLLVAINGHAAQPLRLTVSRGGQRQDVTVTPIQSGDKAIIGASFRFFETYSVKPGPIEAVRLSLAQNWDWTRQIGQTLAGLVTRSTSVKQLMGPVAIMDLSGSAAAAGWIPLFTLLAMISLNLGLMNLLPIPVLDGGHIAILALEGLARRDFSLKAKERMLGVGLVLLLLLMATVIFNDLMRLTWMAKLVQIDLLTSALAFLFVLGVLIFVHELGHFLMARRIGVRVLTFSLGFGPKLINIKRGDTEYCISAIPLGGYVKMAGENPEDSRTGASDEFLSKGKWQRFQVLVMGPIMNLVLAVIVMAVVLYQGADVPAFERDAVVVGTFSDTSVAAKAGLKAGDRIVTIDGKPVDTWEQFANAIVPKAKREVNIGFIRDGTAGQVTVVPEGQGKYELGDIGVQPSVRPMLLDFSPGSPAEEAGFQNNDVILSAGGIDNISHAKLIETIKANEGKPVTMKVERGGVPKDIVVTPRKIGGLVMVGAHINPYEVRSVKPGALEAVKLSFQKNWEWTRQIVETLAGLFTRETSVKQLMGPVAIADLSGTAAQAGWVSLFTLMAMISLNLGLLNLMPIPVLDGGHIFILALEGLARRDFSMRIKEKMLLAGFVLLLMLMVTVIYNDLMRIQWIEKFVPWR